MLLTPFVIVWNMNEREGEYQVINEP